jgi:Uncharacterized integral membrane protein (DUF2301)
VDVYGPFEGAYGTWKIEREDVIEVWSYRVGLTAVVGGAHVPPDAPSRCHPLMPQARAGHVCAPTPQHTFPYHSSRHHAHAHVCHAAFLATCALCSTAHDGTLPEGTAAAVYAALAVLGAAGLGVSVVQIHIYVTPLKRTLQALSALGVAGGTWLALAHPDTPLPLLVAQQSWTMWLLGPAAAAVTGMQTLP